MSHEYIENRDSEDPSIEKLRRDIDRRKNKLYEDLTLAQTLHPELSPVLKNLCYDLFDVDVLVEKDCVTIGCT